MKVLKSVGKYKVNKGELAANGLYNVTHQNGNVSLWFDEETKNELVALDGKEFQAKAKELINI